ncbi:MAG: hypothetical protein J6Q94_07525 [Clostridia bacterium]|nr:hypothetical protein [Clostridia bacterium]
MLKTMSTVKKIIFGILMLYMISGLSFFFLYSCSEISFVTEFIYAMNWDLTFFNDGVILPIFIFIPAAFIIAAIVWIFYRKETSVLLRSIITVVPFWQLITFYGAVFINMYYSLSELKFLLILPIAGFVAIYYFLFRELIRLFRQT